ncbi:MAG: ROK family protein [Ktedonobacterales bacterium]|nr:ROK family protein [Ktedonobacterales bacterium]
MTARYAVGIDIGGTKIFAGVINLETGEVLGTARKRTHPERGADFFTERLLKVAEGAIEAAKLPAKAEISAIGAGIAGQVDRVAGVLLTGPNLGRGLDNLPVRDLLSKRFKVPVTLGNDVEVATLGEQYFGAGRGGDDFVCVFVGTGIGSGIVYQGATRRGATGTAGEIGHTVVQYGGRLCGCGGRGHLEAYASRTAITRVLLAELRRGRVTMLADEVSADDLVIRSKTIARCVEAGDALVLETLAEAADYLGAGLGSLATFYNPRRIILGGGLVEAVAYFFERASLRAHEVALPVPGRALDIVRTALGDNSGIVGAAWMADSALATPA